MLAINPVRLHGRWLEGYALDIHHLESRLRGYDEYGNTDFEHIYSEIGTALRELKYHRDRSQVPALVEAALRFVRSWNPATDCVVPVPATRWRFVAPVPLVAHALARELGITYGRGWVRSIRKRPEIKTIKSSEERARLLESTYHVRWSKVRGRSVLLFDDIVQSGATMDTVTRALLELGGAKHVFALALTRTRVV